MVLSSFEMYPSSDIDASAMTFAMTCSFFRKSVLLKRPVVRRKLIGR